MSNIAIRVENLGKQYRIGTRQRGYKTLRESIADTLTSPFVRWRGRRRATIDGSSGHPSSVFAPSNSHSALRTPQSDYIWALKDVSFEIKQGEVVGIIGRNGAGKSTLLKTLSRITEPTEGVAEIRGRVGSLLEVGTGFHPELTGRENIYLNGAILGMHKAQIDRNLDSIVAFAEIEQFLDTPVKRYSSGMYVRLAFAVAAHLAPDVLLVDEVLAVGDAQFQKKCLGKMQDVSLHEGRTILFVSHNMGVVANLCGRVILLENGIVRRDGEPGAVIAEYISASHRPQDEVVWAAADAAAGNARMRLHRARILCRGRACSDVEIDQDVMIEYDFEILGVPGSASSSIHVHDKHGVWAFCGGTRSEQLSPGQYRHRCRIPANFLNDGLYTVTIFLILDVTRIQVQVRDAIAFFVHETGVGREEFGGVIGGCVRPWLEWQQEALDGLPESRG